MGGGEALTEDSIRTEKSQVRVLLVRLGVRDDFAWAFELIPVHPGDELGPHEVNQVGGRESVVGSVFFHSTR